MAAENNEQIVRGGYDAFNKHELDRLSEFFADDVDWFDVPSGKHYTSLDECRREWRDLFAAVPDATDEITNLFSAGDWVIAEVVHRGTQSGPFTMPSGERIQPTGRRVEEKACEVFQLRNGKIVAGRVYYDMLGILRQLGVMPEMRKAA